MNLLTWEARLLSEHLNTHSRMPTYRHPHGHTRHSSFYRSRNHGMERLHNLPDDIHPLKDEIELQMKKLYAQFLLCIVT